MASSIAAPRHFLRQAWVHRRLVTDLIRRDLRVRYLGSALGGYWNLVHPLAMIAIYTIVFSQVMQARIGGAASPFSFTLYLCAGLIPWNAFTETVTRGTVIFQEHAHLIKKVSFPREILLLISSGSAAVTFGISMVLYLALMLAIGHGVTMHLLWIPAFFAVQFFFGLGLGMILGVLNVFFRDVQQMVAIVFQVWFWLTPIVYLADRVPAAFQVIITLNPFAYFAALYQRVCFQQLPPLPRDLLVTGGLAGATFLLGVSMLYHFKNELVDEL